MIHQVIDVRVGRGPHQFIDQQAEAEHIASMQAFRDAIPVSVRYVVAPGQRIQGRDGQWFEAGAPIDVADVQPDAGSPAQGRAQWKVFEDLVFEQRICENYRWVDPNANPAR